MKEDITIACGKCMPCRINKTHEWALRCTHETNCWPTNIFVCLTIDDEHLEGRTLGKDKYTKKEKVVSNPWSIYKKELQLFLKRFRKSIDHTIKYFACGEYGDEEYSKRPHYHIIMFGGTSSDFKYSHTIYKKGKQYHLYKHPAWPYGNINIGTCTYDSIRYTTGYIQKKLSGDLAKKEYHDNDLNAPFRLSSQGIGLRWCLMNKNRMLNKKYCISRGKKVPIPKYYKQILGITGTDLEKQIEEFGDKNKLKFMNKGIKEEDVFPEMIKSTQTKLKRISVRENIRKRSY